MSRDLAVIQNHLNDTTFLKNIMKEKNMVAFTLLYFSISTLNHYHKIEASHYFSHPLCERQLQAYQLKMETLKSCDISFSVSVKYPVDRC